MGQLALGRHGVNGIDPEITPRARVWLERDLHRAVSAKRDQRAKHGQRERPARADRHQPDRNHRQQRRLLQRARPVSRPRVSEDQHDQRQHGKGHHAGKDMAALRAPVPQDPERPQQRMLWHQERSG
ncbi:hypothetical protein D9M73_97390 [compost metagenome]